jgi:hypothetical protein
MLRLVESLRWMLSLACTYRRAAQDTALEAT